MRIAIILPLLTARTGPQRFVSDFANALRERGHEVFVYSVFYTPESTFESLKSVNVVEASRVARSLRALAYKFLSSYQRRYGKLGVYIWGIPLSAFITPILSILAAIKHRPDVIFVNSGTLFMGIVKLLVRMMVRKNIKVVVYYHGFLETQAKTFLARILRPIEKFTLLNCIFLTNSKYMARQFLQSIGVMPVVFNIGIDVKWFSSIERRDEGRTLLYVGRIAPYRKQHFLLKVLKYLESKGIECRLILAGSLSLSDMNYYKELLKEVKNLGLEEKVIIANISGDDDLLKLYSKATVYVDPMEETYGINILEALAAGLPVVTCRKGGQLDIVRNGVEGLLVSDDIEEWAKAIQTLLSNEELYYMMSEAARLRAREFSWERVVRKFELLVEQYTRK